MSRDALRVLFIALLSMILGIAIGWKAHIVYGVQPDSRHFVPIPADVAFTPFPVPSPTPIAGLHEYQRPIDVEPKRIPVQGSAAAPGSRTPRRVTRQPKASEGQARRSKARGSDRYTGKASWHATGRDGLYAAACAPLRAAMGRGWRGRRVLVAYRRKAIEVVLNDLCRSTDKTIDLSDEAFEFFAPLSRGVVRVTVGW